MHRLQEFNSSADDEEINWNFGALGIRLGLLLFLQPENSVAIHGNRRAALKRILHILCVARNTFLWRCLARPLSHTNTPATVCSPVPFQSPSHSLSRIPTRSTRWLGRIPIGDADDPTEKNVPLLSSLHQARITT